MQMTPLFRFALIAFLGLPVHPALQAQTQKEAAPPPILGVAETPSGGTTFAGDNFFFSPDLGVTTFPRGGLPSVTYDAPPALRPGMGLPMQFAQGRFWTCSGKMIYKYEPRLKAWAQVAEIPVEFRNFMPLFDGSFLLLKTLELKPNRLLYPKALLERWDGKELHDLIPIPNHVQSTLSIRDFDGPFWKIEMHEFEEYTLIYDCFTGYLAVYQPGKGLKVLTTPWEQVSFNDFFKIQSDSRFIREIEINQKPGGPPKRLPVIRSRAPYPIQFIPTTPGKVLVVFKNQNIENNNNAATIPNGSSQNIEGDAKIFHIYSDHAEAFEIDLATLDRSPVAVQDNVEFPWWFNDKVGLISLAEAFKKKSTKSQTQNHF